MLSAVMLNLGLVQLVEDFRLWHNFYARPRPLSDKCSSFAANLCFLHLCAGFYYGSSYTFLSFVEFGKISIGFHGPWPELGCSSCGLAVAQVARWLAYLFLALHSIYRIIAYEVVLRSVPFWFILDEFEVAGAPRMGSDPPKIFCFDF